MLKNKKGQQMVEFAVVLPVIVLCMGLLVTFGQLIYARMVVQMAAYDGARRAVVMASPSAGRAEADDRARNTLRNAIGMVDGSKQSRFTHSGWSRGGMLEYSVSIRVRTLFPLINDEFEIYNEMTISGTSVTMIERGG